MTEQTLRLFLEPVQNNPNQYIVSWQDACYSTTVRFENDLIFTDLLRALPGLLLGYPKPSWLRLEGDPLKILGERLWKILLPESAPLETRQALAQMLSTETTPLLLSVPKVLNRLPWELLSNPEQQGETSFLARQRPLLRLMDTPSSANVLPLPLKVLVIISSPPALKENARVDVESERSAIMQATREAREAGRLHLLIEDIVTPQRVQQALIRFRPHLVHYIGHGGYDRSVGGVLLWETEQGEVLNYSAQRLAELLRPRQIQAVLLHACETASGHGMLDLPNLAEVLLNASLPAVLAQQANMTYESSIQASNAWYTALTSGLSLVEALFEVRQVLAQANRPDWAVPVLFSNLASTKPLCNLDAPAGLPDPELVTQGAASDLPTPIGVFVGRHHEMQALHLMLEHPPGAGPVLALITGPGGIGKSTLAAQAVTRYGKRYKATLTLRCSAYQGMDLLLQRIGEFLQQLDAPGFLLQTLPKSELSIDAKIRLALTSLNQVGSVLMIVDGLESVQTSDQTLRDADFRHWLHLCLTNLCGSRLLLTGHYAPVDLLPEKRYAAHVLHLKLGDLSDYEIQRLLIRHPTLSRLEENTQRILRDSFGGLPYAYDVLSTKAANQDLDALVHDIQGRITEEREHRTSEEWRKVHQEVSKVAAVATIVDLRLSERSRLVLSGASLLQRPFPLETLEQGLQATRDDWQPLLDWSLIRHDPFAGTYQVHSVTRYHAQKLLTEEERVVRMDRLAHWYADYAWQESHDIEDCLEAHRLWEEAGKTQQAGEFALSLAPILSRFGLYQLLGNLCRTTLENASRNKDEPLTAYASFRLGVLANEQGRYDEACQFFEQSRQLYEQLNDKNGLAATLGELGILALYLGKYDEAQQLFEQSGKISEQLGDQRGIARSLHHLGILAYTLGKHAEARRFFKRSRQVDEQSNDKDKLAASLHYLGALAQDQGDYDEARQLFEQSYQLDEQRGDKSGIASSLHDLAVLNHKQGRHEEARQFYEQSRVIKEQLGDQSGVAGILNNLGRLNQDQGMYPEARQLFEQSRQINEQLGNQSNFACNLQNLGGLVYEQGRYDEARQFFEQSRQINEQLGNQGNLSKDLEELATLACHQQKYDEARRLFEQSRQLHEQLGNQSKAAKVLVQLAILAVEQGDLVQALQEIFRALIIFETLQSTSYIRLAKQIIMNIRAVLGEDAFRVQWQEISGNLPFQFTWRDDSEMSQTIIAFLKTSTWEESKSFLAAHPDLLAPGMKAVFQGLLLIQPSRQARRMLTEHIHLLARCREIGVFEAYQEQAQQAKFDETDDEENISPSQAITEVLSLMQKGTRTQREQFARTIQTLQEELFSENQELTLFLGCLIALLCEEQVESEHLVWPFSALWQEIQIDLQEQVGERKQEEKEGESHG